jgi:acyl dehydratase
VTGDYNPYHQDEAFARESWYGRLTIPGLLTGSMLTHIGGLLGFLATEMSFEYLAPVFVGDTITCTVTIAEKDEERRQVKATVDFVNQDGVEVLRASFAGFPSQVRLAR